MDSFGAEPVETEGRRPARKVGTGLVGVGTISFVHMEGYRLAAQMAEIVAVCDSDRDKAVEVAKLFDCPAYDDYRDLLADPAVTLVDVMLPHSLHHEVVGDALRAGKHVLVEKPMAPTSAQCRELIELARAGDRTFTVAENTRFVSAYQAVAKLLQAGELGGIRLVRASISGSEVERLQDTSSWKGRRSGTVGGAIMDAGAHSFYLFTWLFGGVVEVGAQSWKLIEQSEVEDNAVLTGLLANGALFTLELSFTAELPWGERLEVHGTEASAVVDQLVDPPVVVYRGAYDHEGTPVASVSRDVIWWKGASIAAGVVDVVRAVHEGLQPTVDPVDGLRSVVAVEAAYRSVELGGRAVPVEPEMPWGR